MRDWIVLRVFRPRDGDSRSSRFIEGDLKRPRQDSNLKPLASEANALSNWATGTLPVGIFPSVGPFSQAIS